MQESISFPLSPDTSGAMDNGINLKESFYNELLLHKEVVADLVRGYYFTERKSVSALEIDADSVMVDQEGRGSFMAHFILGMFNACADLDYNDKSGMLIEFAADPDNATMTLTGEYFPEREPDDL
jgi:hypothetical protein